MQDHHRLDHIHRIGIQGQLRIMQVRLPQLHPRDPGQDLPRFFQHVGHQICPHITTLGILFSPGFQG